MKYVVAYKRHDDLMVDARHIGPFDTHREAYEALCKLPALGIHEGIHTPGFKYIIGLESPEMFETATLSHSTPI